MRRALAAFVILQLVALGFMTTSALPAALTSFRSQPWRFSLLYPSDLAAGTRCKTNYFDRGAWRVSYAAGTGPGDVILDLSAPDVVVQDGGGTSVATAELRFGASRDPDVVATCRTYGMNSGNNVETRQVTLGGVAFTEVPDNSDAEQGNSFATDDYRAVFRGVCYAIDLALFTGGTSTRPPVMAPAISTKLRNVLATLHFDQDPRP